MDELVQKADRMSKSLLPAPNGGLENP